MTKKRYLLKYLPYECSNGEIIETDPYFIDTTQEYFDGDEYSIDGYLVMSDKQVCDLLNGKDERIKELEQEILDLKVELGRLNSKKQVEKPHWLKYIHAKCYIPKVNQDIRFDGDYG